METSDLASDADNTNATIATNFPTESKSVKRRSSERSLSVSHSGIGYSGFDGRNKTMSRPTTFPYAMTLRLSNEMQNGLEDLAYDLRLSRAGTIRRILRRAITDARHGGTSEWPHRAECDKAFTNPPCGRPGALR
jgi:hypothetical protein